MEWLESQSLFRVTLVIGWPVWAGMAVSAIACWMRCSVFGLHYLRVLPGLLLLFWVVSTIYFIYSIVFVDACMGHCGPDIGVFEFNINGFVLFAFVANFFLFFVANPDRCFFPPQSKRAKDDQGRL